MGIATFCPIHLKIHECPENSNKAISSATENKIRDKMNRMLNPTPTIVSSSENSKNKFEKGTIQAILADAKKNNQKIKTKLGLENEQGMSQGVDESDIQAKMARLRANVSKKTNVSSDFVPPISKNEDRGLEEIIDSAHQINRKQRKKSNQQQENNLISNLPIDQEQFDDEIKQKLEEVKKVPSKRLKSKSVQLSQKKNVLDAHKTPTEVLSPTTPIFEPERTVILTASEIETLIEKAVAKAIKKSKSEDTAKKKR